MDTEGFAKRLSAVIDELGITADEAAVRARVGKLSMYEYTKGKRFPGVYNLHQICQNLGVSADWLLGFDVPRWR